MSDKTNDQYEAELKTLKTENAELRKEIERMRQGSTFALTGSMSIASQNSGSLTILGIEEMILQIGKDDTVGYVNAPMAKLLGMPDRKKALGTALNDWDREPLGAGVLRALMQVARTSEQPHALERTCPDMPQDRLPEISLPKSIEERILRFTASAQKGRVHIVAQDVTRLRWLENTFSRYVSPKVIEQMQSIRATDFFTMDRREVTIIFADLRGFTAMCQELPPDQIQETVNSFLTNMVDCIEKQDGTIDKFVGDEVMAIFGAPVPQEDHFMRGLVCAVEMQRMHQAWETSRQAEGKPTRPAGIGLASGTVVVGNIGTESRMDFTAQGHTVNLAARLCSAAAGGEVLTIPETHTGALDCLKNYSGQIPVPRLSFSSKGKMEFKNVFEPVEVLSVVTK